MKMKAKCSYLSIDLDYWNFQRSENARIFFRKMFRKCQCLTNIDIVEKHDDLLDFVDDKRFNFDEVINLDYHDDLSSYSVDFEPHEGNWIGAVPWRDKASYVWRYPHFNEKHCNNGICGMNESDLYSEYDRYGVSKCGWQNVRMSHGSRIDYSTVKKIGISISPEYLEPGIIDFITCNLLRANIAKSSFHGNSWDILTQMSEAKSEDDLPDGFGKYRAQDVG